MTWAADCGSPDDDDNWVVEYMQIAPPCGHRMDAHAAETSTSGATAPDAMTGDPRWLLHQPHPSTSTTVCEQTLTQLTEACSDGDVSLLCSDKQSRRAHSQLLALHSPFLKAELRAAASLPDGSRQLPVAETSMEWALLLGAMYLPESEEVFNIDNAYTLARLAKKYGMKRLLKLIGDCIIVAGPDWHVVFESRVGHPTRNRSRSRSIMHFPEVPERATGGRQEREAFLTPSCIHNPRHILQLLHLAQHTGHAVAIAYVADLLEEHCSILCQIFQGASFSEFPEILQDIGLALVGACASALRRRNPGLYAPRSGRLVHEDRDGSTVPRIYLSGSGDDSSDDASAGTFPGGSGNDEGLVNGARGSARNGHRGSTAGLGGNTTSQAGDSRGHGLNAANNSRDRTHRSGDNGSPILPAAANPELLSMTADGDIILHCKRDGLDVHAHMCVLRQHSDVLRDMLSVVSLLGTEVLVPGGNANWPMREAGGDGNAAGEISSSAVVFGGNGNRSSDAGGAVAYSNESCKRLTNDVGEVPSAATASGAARLEAAVFGAGQAPRGLGNRPLISRVSPVWLAVDDSSLQWLAALAVMYPLDDDGGCPAGMVHPVLELADKYNMVAVKRRVMVHWSAHRNLAAMLKEEMTPSKMEAALKLLSLCSSESLENGARLCSSLLGEHLDMFFEVMVDVAESQAPVLSPAAWWLVVKKVTEKARGW